MEQLMMLKFANEPVEYKMPAGYEIRSVRDGNHEDAMGWIYACETLNEGLWNEEQFVHEMIEDSDCGSDNILLICRKNDGAIAGTATAKDGPLPALHMVGMNKEFFGQGLSYAICAAALNRMINHGVHRIQLKTDEFRIPAIKTYLKMGFRPWYYLDDMPARWQGVFADLGYDPEKYFAYDATSFRRIPV